MALFLIVALPPPKNGQTIVNAALTEQISLRALRRQCQVINIGPRTSIRSIAYHVTRNRAVLNVVFRLWRLRRDPIRRVYGVVESGYGIFYNFVIVCAARTFGYSIVLHHHTSLHVKRNRLSFRLLSYLVGSECTHVVLCAEMQRDLMQRYPHIRNIVVCNNSFLCLHQNEPCVRTLTPGKRHRIGLLSNLSKEKGLDIAIDVGKMARQIGFDITIALAGPAVGAQAQISLDLVAHDKDLFEVLGSVDQQQKDRFYKSIDIFIFPSQYRFEAQPLVLLEAMAEGVPIITTDIGYIRDFVDPDAIIDNGKPLAQAFFARVAELLQDEDLYRRSSMESLSRISALKAESKKQLSEVCDLLTSGISEENV